MTPFSLIQHNIKSIRGIIPYLGVFIILFTGTYSKNLNESTLVFYLIKYTIPALLIGLGILFYLKKDYKNFLKLSIFIAFTINYQLHVVFIFLTLFLFNKKLLVPFNSPLKPIYLLFGMGLISYIINQFIQLNILSFPVFIFTFFLPFIFWGLFYNYGYGYKDELIEFFFNIVLIMSGIIILQFLLHPDLHPDYWNGGTPNAHIAAAYISIAFFLSIAKVLELKHVSFIKHFREIIIIFSSLPLLFLTDAKYFLLLILFILIVYFIVSPFIQRKIKALAVGTLAFLSIVFFSTPDKPIPISILTIHSQSYNFNTVNTDFFNSPKYQLLQTTLRLPFYEPLTFLIGSGPGTFLSRAAFIQNTMSKNDTQTSYNFGREKSIPLSKIALKDTWIRDKYAKFSFKKEFDQGSLFNRRSGLISIYFELGVIGLILFILFHVGIIKIGLQGNGIQKKKHDMALIVLPILFFAINYFSYWCEYQNYSILQYGILGILLAQTSEKTEDRR